MRIVRFERAPSRAWWAAVIGGLLALGIALAVVALGSGDERPRVLPNYRDSDACKRDPYASACQPVVIAPRTIYSLTTARPDGCDEALSQARLRRDRGETPLVRPTLHLGLGSSATWFANERDAKLFAQLKQVRPADVDFDGIGTS